MKKKILLHACCAPCTAGVWNQLKDDFEVTLFWYNPNIFPKAEHDRRLNELLNFCDQKNIRIMVGDYNWVEEHAYWLETAKGLEDEPEKGKRCEACYKMRLEAVAAVAAQANDHHDGEFDFFGAELSISPHKNSEMINEIGNNIAEEFGINFFKADFKKNDGFKKGAQIFKKLNLYRQDYCGCEFSQTKK
ncbi:MAG: epoxyqueuosine reductase QueH [Candidatus Berkelbacteria bacterium]|nr:epoxyqueuosine reductase QueH [Candidatus Berkelbacteria bacterium]